MLCPLWVFMLEGLQLFSFCCNQQDQTVSYNNLHGPQPQDSTELGRGMRGQSQCHCQAWLSHFTLCHHSYHNFTPLSLYLDWSLSGTRLHPGGFICDFLSSPTLPISHSYPSFLCSFSPCTSLSLPSHLSVSLSYLSSSISCNGVRIIC